MRKNLKKLLASFLVVALLFSMLMTLPAAAATVSIKTITIDPISVMENTNGWFDADFNPETENYDLRYYRYQINYMLDFKITFSDGSVIQDNDIGFFCNDEWHDFVIETGQSYENQWTAGNTYQVTVSAMGKSAQVPVTITESPLESITIKEETAQVEIIEGTNGYWDEVWNPETGEEDLQYFRYYDNAVTDNLEYTITFKDGSEPIVGKGGYFEYDGEEYWLGLESDQSYYNQWTVGNTYQVMISALGKMAPVDVTIIESPVENILFDPVEIIEGTNGYWDTDYNPETDEFDLRYYRYEFRKDIPYTITFNDGSEPIKVSKDSNGWFQYKGEDYSVGWNSEQSYENQWTVGNTYKAEVSALGKTVSVDVTIAESPVKSIAVEPIVIRENTHGYWEENDYGDEYFRYDWDEVLQCSITMNDDTVVKTSYGSFVYRGQEYNLDYIDTQSEEDCWTAGHTYKAEVFVMGKSEEVSVTIETFDVKKIEILKSKPVTAGETSWYDRIEDNYPIPLFTYRITMKDGTTMVKYSDDSEDVGLRVTHQQDITPWTVGGKNTVTVSIGKVSTTFSANLSGRGESGYDFIEQDGGAFITGCFLTDKTLTVPSVLSGKTVKGIMSLGRAVEYATQIKIPDSVTFLSENVFSDWESSVQSLEIGKGVADLNVETFAHAPYLKSVTVSASNPYYKSVSGVVYNKAGDTVVYYPVAKGETFVVPAAVENVDIFYQYKNSIYSDIQLDFSKNTNAYVVEDGITYNKAKTKVIACDPKKTGDYVMPDTVTSILDGAFQWSSLSHIEMSDNVTEIVYGAFAGCKNMTIDLPANLQKISSMAFADSNITAITLPNSLKTIDDMAFVYSSLHEITIPGSVQTVGELAFSYCPNLAQVTVETSGGTKIGDFAFFECTKLTTLTLGEGVQSVGAMAFADTKLTAITLPDSLETIGVGAFGGCEIAEITMGNKVSSIGAYAFAANPLSDVTLPDSVTEIAYGAFACENFANMELPNAVVKMSVATGADSPWMDTLENGYAGNILIYAGNKNYNAGSDATEFTVNPGTTVIADMAFQNMEKLETVTLPDGLLSIGSMAFFNCSSMETITIPASVTYIAPDAFIGCTALKTIQVDPENACYSSVDGVLYNKDQTELIVCPKREDATFTVPESVLNIKSYAFGLSGVTKISIGDNTKLEKNAINATLNSRDIGLEVLGTLLERALTPYEIGIEAERFMVTAVCTRDSYAYRYALDNLLDLELHGGYTITYKLDGGKNNAANPSGYGTREDDIILHNPTKSGYTFKGWYSDAKFTKKVTKIASGSTGNKTFYALWAKTYTITYKLNGGTNSASNPKTYTKIDATITLKNPTRKGYTFKGWYSDAKFKKKVTKIAKGSTGNKTLYAKWAKNTYKITYKLNSGKNNAKNPKTYTVTTATITLKNPTRKGYTFKGWYSDAKFKTKVTKITKGSTGNKTLYAKWAATDYKVIYKLNGGKNNAKNPATYTIATATVTLKNPSRTGYTFQGWYSDAKFKTKVTKITKGSTGNKTLYAKWKKK